MRHEKTTCRGVACRTRRCPVRLRRCVRRGCRFPALIDELRRIGAPKGFATVEDNGVTFETSGDPGCVFECPTASVEFVAESQVGEKAAKEAMTQHLTAAGYKLSPWTCDNDAESRDGTSRIRTCRADATGDEYKVSVGVAFPENEAATAGYTLLAPGDV